MECKPLPENEVKQLCEKVRQNKFSAFPKLKIEI